ncbi:MULTISPECIES: DUF6439 family protein [unclassified Synechococcus]|uniref:DUF6439 family protein n=1 Tax=unclassified Synechococcus TaxID=2626047 RepID=UPI0021A563CE|nr:MULTISPECIES: DUF6439 family protein [unclassified Synechococcus]
MTPPSEIGVPVGIARANDPAAPRSPWPDGSRQLAEALHRLLVIQERDWHAHKGQKPRRGAEQIAAALVQLVGDDSSAKQLGGEAQVRAIALLEQGLAWLKGDLKDPGCPSHGR